MNYIIIMFIPDLSNLALTFFNFVRLDLTPVFTLGKPQVWTNVSVTIWIHVA